MEVSYLVQLVIYYMEYDVESKNTPVATNLRTQ